MFQKILVKDVIVKHLRTLYDARKPDKKIWWADIFIFYIIPALLGVVVAFTFPTYKYQEALLVVSVLAGLSFASVIFVFQLRLNMGERWEKGEAPLQLIDELFANLLYSVLIALMMVIMSLFPSGGRVLVGVFSFFASHYIFTLLLCVKRLSAVFRETTR